MGAPTVNQVLGDDFDDTVVEPFFLEEEGESEDDDHVDTDIEAEGFVPHQDRPLRSDRPFAVGYFAPLEGEHDGIY